MQSSIDSSTPRKRRRTAKSCEQCRHRKIGCDQAHPCGPCRRSRDHLTCTYRDLATMTPPDVQPGANNIGTGSNATDSGAERSHQPHSSGFELSEAGQVPAARTGASGALATAFSNGHRQAAGQSPDCSIVTGPGAGSKADDKIHRLEERIARLEAEVRSAQRGVNGQASTSYLSSHATTTVPSMRFTKAKVKLFTQSHWVHTAEKVGMFPTRDSNVRTVGKSI